MPFFRYPDTNAEMSYFMQKNDVFVEVVLRAYDLYQRVLWRSEVSVTFLNSMRRLTCGCVRIHVLYTPVSDA